MKNSIGNGSNQINHFNYDTVSNQGVRSPRSGGASELNPGRSTGKKHDSGEGAANKARNERRNALVKLNISAPEKQEISVSAKKDDLAPDSMPQTINIDGRKYSINYSQRPKEAGKNIQLKATLKYLNENIQVRIKVSNRSNESLAYQNMLRQRDSMAQFLPKFYGTIDSAGKALEFNRPSEIANPAFLVIRDEVSFLESQSFRVINEESLHVKDFKLSDKNLRSDSIERKINGFPDKSATYYASKDLLMNLSRSPFVTHNGGSVDKVRRMAQTNSSIDSMFNSVTDKNGLISDLKNLRESMRKSDFVFIDSSFLFIPIKDKYGNVSISIKFIDPTHSLHKSSNHPEFSVKKDATVKSIDWLIDRAHKSS